MNRRRARESTNEIPGRARRSLSPRRSRGPAAEPTMYARSAAWLATRNAGLMKLSGCARAHPCGNRSAHGD